MTARGRKSSWKRVQILSDPPDDVSRDDETVRRTRRVRTLCTRARLAADASEESDIKVDPVVPGSVGCATNSARRGVPN